MESVSHLSVIPSQIYEEHFENKLNLVGKSITFVNTLVNADDIYNIPDFWIEDRWGNRALFPKGNYNVDEFVDQLIEVGSILPKVDPHTSSIPSETEFGAFSKDGNFLWCYSYFLEENNADLYKYLPPYYSGGVTAHYGTSCMEINDSYIERFITWQKIYMLRVYCNFIDSDNDLITIPLYTQKGLDNTFSLSDLCIPCIDGIYNDIQWSVYDQLNNPIPFENSKLHIYFTAS